MAILHCSHRCPLWQAQELSPARRTRVLQSLRRLSVTCHATDPGAEVVPVRICPIGEHHESVGHRHLDMPLGNHVVSISRLEPKDPSSETTSHAHNPSLVFKNLPSKRIQSFCHAKVVTSHSTPGCRSLLCGCSPRPEAPERSPSGSRVPVYRQRVQGTGKGPWLPGQDERRRG